MALTLRTPQQIAKSLTSTHTHTRACKRWPKNREFNSILRRSNLLDKATAFTLARFGNTEKKDGEKDRQSMEIYAN